jgi:hypothetical protein
MARREDDDEPRITRGLVAANRANRAASAASGSAGMLSFVGSCRTLIAVVGSYRGGPLVLF